MLQSLDEVRKVEMPVGGIINGVDNANLLSVDSTSPITTDIDELPPEEETESGTVKTPEKVAKKVEELKDDETPPEKDKTDYKDKVAVQKRIDELTKKRRTAERERDYIKTSSEKRIAELEEELQKLQSKVLAEGKPNRDDFAEDEDYLEALADWKVDQKLKASEVKALKTATEEDDKEAIKKVFEGMDEAMESGREKYKDFNDLVLHEDLVLSESLVEVILVSDLADELFYYFGKNPDKSEEFSQMSPLKAAKEIGKLEEIVVKENNPEVEEDVDETPPEPKVETPPKKKISTAPPPIDPVKTTGAVDKDPSQMTHKEYRAWRERNKG